MVQEGMSCNDQVINFDDFHQQFLNNHPSTIEEDFEGENLISEMTSQQTAPEGTDRKTNQIFQMQAEINRSEIKREEPACVQILNSEPVRRFQLPDDKGSDSSSEKENQQWNNPTKSFNKDFRNNLTVKPEVLDFGTIFIG